MADEKLPLDSSLFFKLVRIVNLTARPFHDSVSRQHHLTLNEWRVMVVLASHPGLPASEVADITGLDKMSVSRALAGLQKHDRLLRKNDPVDQRKTRLSLSAAGQRLFVKIGAQAKLREAELFAGVSAGELKQTNATLDKLIAAVHKADA
jgi:DNA-binding MarR family transcriptional regulator